jgi:hypothetical protein
VPPPRGCGHQPRPGAPGEPGALAKRYGLGGDALYRHSRNHLPPQLRAKLLAGPDIGTGPRSVLDVMLGMANDAVARQQRDLNVVAALVAIL